MKLSKKISSHKTTNKQMQAEWLIPENKIRCKVLLHIHGGGFISGSCAKHRVHVAKFAAGYTLKSLVFD